MVGMLERLLCEARQAPLALHFLWCTSKGPVMVGMLERLLCEAVSPNAMLGCCHTMGPC